MNTDNRLARLRAMVEAMTVQPWADNGNGMIVAPEDTGDTMLVHGEVTVSGLRSLWDTAAALDAKLAEVLG